MQKRVHIFVSGIVQGVFYRSYTKEKAISLGLKGFVRNLNNGQVEIVAEGEEDALQNLVEWCYTGSPSSLVTDVKAEFSSATNEFKIFSIVY